MSLRTKYTAIVRFLAARTETRRVTLVRGVLLVLAPVALACALTIIYNGRTMLFNVALDYHYGAMPRWKDVMNDWLMIGYGGFGLFCEIAGFNFFRMTEKKFD